MPDAIIAQGNQLDLNALGNAQGHVDRHDDGTLRISQARLKTGFLFKSTSPKHAEGFRQVQTLAAQYGVGIAQQGRIFHTGNLHVRIAANQQANRAQMNGLINAVRTAHAHQGDNAWNGYFVGKQQVDRLVEQFRAGYNGPGRDQSHQTTRDLRWADTLSIDLARS